MQDDFHLAHEYKATPERWDRAAAFLNQVTDGVAYRPNKITPFKVDNTFKLVKWYINFKRS